MRKNFGKMMQKIFGVVHSMSKNDVSDHAASTAFFFFVSLVPMLVALCTILPYTPLKERHLIGLAQEIVPVASKELVIGLIEYVYRKSAGAMSIAILVTLWTAGKGVLALIRGLNAINQVEERRNYFVLRLISSFYTLIMLIVLILFLGVMVFGDQLVQLFFVRMPQLKIMASLYMEFRFLIVWPVLTALFAIVYAYVPNRRLRLKEQVPGACFSAVAWSVFSWFFSLYVSISGVYSIYGSLSIIVILMIWMYVGMYILFIGASINHELAKKDV